MHAKNPGTRSGAFSLVEVVLALGLFAFCIVVILGLLGTVMNSSKDSWMESRAAQIARQIASDLLPDPVGDASSTSTATPLAGMLVTLPNPIQLPLIPAATTTNTVYYSTDGEPVAPDAPNAVFRADVVLTPVVLEPAAGTLPERKASQLRIDIRPATQTNAAPFQFVARVTPQVSKP